ncbi:MAG: penicillin-binding transpeptidase domain-containing protein [Oscillospiraceae bacterium]|nr:penicillin-binding transpeptidase domain-containing protein [Oscillospiraceae bacterium]
MKRQGRGEAAPNKQILSRTLVLMVVCGILAFVVLGVQLFYIQIIQHDELEQRAIGQQLRATTVAASRGTIFDVTGTIMAQSADVENVFISPLDIHQHNEDRNLIARGLAEILDVEEEMVLARMENTASQYETIRRQIDRELGDEVRAFIVEHGLKSIHLEPAVRRYYPRERTGSHILGFVGTDGTGMGYGVEGSYDRFLAGVNGRVVRLKSARGVDMLHASYEDYFSAQPGHDVHLTIDTNIQQIMERHMNQAVRDFDLQGGGFSIAMNPNTGAILGMVSLNDFNPNSHGRLPEARMDALRLRHGDNDDAFWAAVLNELQYSWRNKNIGYTYEPGSTFKLVTLAIALEEGIITPNCNHVFYCAGSVEIDGRVEPLNCARRSGHGAQNLTQVMQGSCNVGTAELAMMIGPDLFYEYLLAFGLVETTGIDLGGETMGILWGEEQWNYYHHYRRNFSSLAVASIGQTFTLTPIRLATVISALSNGGYIVEPFVVERVVAQDGTVVQENETQVRRQVISRETSEAVLEIMERTVSESRGTGTNAAVEGFRIGGKTGTSTDTVLEALTGRSEHIVSFVSAAPVDNPEIVILVSLIRPGPNNQTGVSGGQMAAPVVGAMMRDILPYLGVESRFAPRAERINAQVPYVRRLSVAEARRELEAEGFTVAVQGAGERVTDQMPAGGAVVVVGTQVILYLDGERPADQVTVPDVLWMRYEDARAALEARGLYVRRQGTFLNHSAVLVSAQSRTPTEVVRRGTVVEITLIDTTEEDAV